MPGAMSSELLNITVISNVNDFESLRRFPSDITLGDLKCKLELLTGINGDSMQLELMTAEKRLIGKLADMTQTVQAAGIKDGMVLSVIDPTGGNNSMVGQSGNVPKFELSEEEYSKRTDSVLAWKQKQKLGRFNTESEAEKQAQEAAIVKKSKELASKIKVGNRCKVSLTNQPVKRGVVSFVGETSFKPGFWIGVTYDEPVGKNDGSVQGKRYFKCAPKYGGMIRPQDIEVGDFPPELDMELDEI